MESTAASMEPTLEPTQEEEDSKEYEVSYKLVPWINWDEWNFVRESLFSSSPDSIATALKRIATWKVRGNLPIAIDVTASIIEVQQKDPKFRKDLNSGDLISEELLGMLYCMANLRLVNGVIDQDRRKRDRRELSINQAADEIGLPRMLVDIRHESSHRDLPSLQLVREASVEALDWIISYYWEPQRNAIPFQKDKVDYVRNKIKSKLSDLAFYVNAKPDTALLPMKRKRSKQSNVNLGRFNHFSQKVKKLHESHSRGSKKQIKRIFKALFRLYTSFPSEVVMVLLDILLKALDSTGSTDVDPSDNSVDYISGNLETQSQIEMTDICKLVITRLSSNESELILIMLRAVLETLETRKTTLSEAGRDFSCSESKVDIHRTKHLSSIVLWLTENYVKIKYPNGMSHELQDSSEKALPVPKVALAELVKKCLLLSSPENNRLTKSALLLSQMTGNSYMVDKLKKFLTICSTDSDIVQSTSCIGTEQDITRQEMSITQATKTLNSLKQCRNKGKTASITSDDDATENGGWKVAKSWNLCPIGMLPSSWGCTGILPSLDRPVDLQEVQNVPKEVSWELNPCGGKTDGSHDAEFFENMDDVEEEVVVEDDQADNHDSSLEPFVGRLLIGGVYRKVCADELLAIEATVRILV